ncbi:hypothetical protein ACHZ98_23350 [Streptomyces sp. MAR4 CNY-716]
MGKHTRAIAIWTAGLCAAGLAATAGVNSLPGGSSAGSGIPSPTAEPGPSGVSSVCRTESECDSREELKRKGFDCGTPDADGEQICVYAELTFPE